MTTSSEGPEERVIGQVIRRLIPFIFLCYVVAYIDRVNIGFAAADMQKDLGLQRRRLRVRRRPLLPRLLPLRDPEQPHPRAGGRAPLDRPHHVRAGASSRWP